MSLIEIEELKQDKINNPTKYAANILDKLDESDIRKIPQCINVENSFLKQNNIYLDNQKYNLNINKVKCNCEEIVELFDIGDGKFFDGTCLKCRSFIIQIVNKGRWSNERWNETHIIIPKNERDKYIDRMCGH